MKTQNVISLFLVDFSTPPLGARRAARITGLLAVMVLIFAPLAGAWAQTGCPDGYYSIPSNSSCGCYPCPANGTCKNDQLTCDDGYYKIYNVSAKYAQCETKCVSNRNACNGSSACTQSSNNLVCNKEIGYVEVPIKRDCDGFILTPCIKCPGAGSGASPYPALQNCYITSGTTGVDDKGSWTYSSSTGGSCALGTISGTDVDDLIARLPYSNVYVCSGSDRIEGKYGDYDLCLKQTSSGCHEADE